MPERPLGGFLIKHFIVQDCTPEPGAVDQRHPSGQDLETLLGRRDTPAGKT